LILRIDHVLFGSDFGFGNDYLARTVIDITELALDETAVRMLTRTTRDGSQGFRARAVGDER
jgi:hypothetical protein